MFANTPPDLAQDLFRRLEQIQPGIRGLDANALLVTTPVNLLYITGKVFSGFVWIPRNGSPHIFVRRPHTLAGNNVHHIRNPEEIPAILAKIEDACMPGNGLDFKNTAVTDKITSMPGCLALEGEEILYSTWGRLARLGDKPAVNGSGLFRRARSLKTPYEIAVMREGGLRHAKAIGIFAKHFKPGMTDHQFAIECEHVVRRAGSLGLFRIFGGSMECYSGTVLAGDNAGAASPYDFALGGAGLDASLPVGQNGTKLKPGMTVMADVAFNFRGYLTDCSRTFSIGKPSPEMLAAHQCCVDIQSAVANAMRPGVSCEELYKLSLNMADEAGFADRFMGLSQKAKFIGHGTGLYINEWPVLGLRATAEIQHGNVVALEPKIVLPGIGAVGVEDTFVITDSGAENITPCKQEIIEL